MILGEARRKAEAEYARLKALWTAKPSNAVETEELADHVPAAPEACERASVADGTAVILEDGMFRLTIPDTAEGGELTPEQVLLRALHQQLADEEARVELARYLSEAIARKQGRPAGH